MHIPRKWRRTLLYNLSQSRAKIKSLRNSFKDVEVELYDLNKKAAPFSRNLNIVLAALTIISLVMSDILLLDSNYGLINSYFEFAIVIGFIFNYLFRLVLTSNRIELVKSKMLETILFVFLIISGFLVFMNYENALEALLKLTSAESTFALLVLLTKIYLLIYLVVKVIQALPILLALKQHPAQVVVTSYFSFILLGMILLMLPRSTVNNEGLDFIDALFTSTSAVCVTGLAVVNTATHLTTFGQVVVLLLIEIGGLGILTFATLFALFLSSGLGVGQMTFLKDVVSEDSTAETLNTIKKILGLSVFIQVLGVVGYYISWVEVFPDAGLRLYYAVFHSVSAFCNAGFSVFSNSMADPENALNWGVNITTILLVVVGGLGFTTIWELVKGNRNRSFNQWNLSIHTRLVLISTAVLLVGGTVAFLALEWNGILKDYATSDKLLVSLFQSVITRTAGFNSVDIGALSVSTTVIFLTLMIIGASPASTAGGIKTTTVSVILLTVWAVIIGKNKVEFSRRTIMPQTILTALTAFTLAAVCLFVFTFALTVTEDLPFLDLIFEEFSAFATVGLSRGITPLLSDGGKYIIMISMFIGRVGSVTLALAFANRKRIYNYNYPTEAVIVA